uniref:hypothetical protein n=1 Tax=Erythrolobus coxiae TaxID=362235 RepID=UPI001FCD232D|nr:hypothetical protein MW556_pgp103 [Erythrolobus coxiae]UNJ17704.1 hypothetical protein [Erythrolobus coxiae]
MKKSEVLDNNMNHLLESLRALNSNQQIEKIKEIDQNEPNSNEILICFLKDRRHTYDNFPSYVDGFAYQTICQNNYSEIKLSLESEFPSGIIALNTAKNMDYDDLQNLLIHKKFQQADKVTQEKLRTLAEVQNREWLYFTDIQKIPEVDLQTIDKLWRIYSLDKFGFSVQRKIWLQLGKNWMALWPKIGWQVNDNLCRYPNEFVWDLSGPKGHLPLFNQLRGVQVLSALFNHKVWDYN